jgi:hypothetical protein
MIIAKASRTENCKRLNSNSITVGVIGIGGNSTCSPLKFPFKIMVSIMLYMNFFTASLVPLQMGGGFMFHKIMMPTSIFNARTYDWHVWYIK